MDSIMSSNNSSIANKDLDRHSVDYQPSPWADYFLKHPFLPHTHKACMQLRLAFRFMLFSLSYPFLRHKAGYFRRF